MKISHSLPTAFVVYSPEVTAKGGIYLSFFCVYKENHLFLGHPKLLSFIMKVSHRPIQ